MKVQIEISSEDATLIRQFTAATTDEHSSHGRLSLKALAEMLMQDVALMVRRPGSWEGASMIALLSSHGYEDATDCGVPEVQS
ncbi:MAG: hypothetical protein K2Z80_01220 [Xanthobacteraceae bacterium]|nr:hypothetical protein [Xanthobacteraceae bacterium]